jgi:hypothetical protein
MRMTGNTILVTRRRNRDRRGLAESLHRLGNQVLVAREPAAKMLCSRSLPLRLPGRHGNECAIVDRPVVSSILTGGSSAVGADSAAPTSQSTCSRIAFLRSPGCRTDHPCRHPEVGQWLGTSLCAVDDWSDVLMRSGTVFLC